MLGRDQIINTATSPSSSAAVAPSDCDFEVRFSIRKKDTDGQVAFKLDGGRFKKTELQEPCPDIYLRTYKFICDAVYKITITSRPNVVFNELNISGNSMELHLDNGVYSTEWDTTVFPVTAKGSREYLSLCLQGPGKTVRRKLQAKFYRKDDSHANYGDKLETLTWKCAPHGTTGEHIVVDEILE